MASGAVLLAPVLLLILACAKAPVVAPQAENVVFCTDEKPPVKGALYYPCLVQTQDTEGRIGVAGKLIFKGLKGWYTSEPLPSVAYWDRDEKNTYVERPRHYRAYWTGNPDTLCIIRTQILIAGFPAETFDSKRISLVYYASELTGSMIIGPDEKKNISFFRLDYDQKPLSITRLYVIDRPGPDIRHALVIHADVSP
jgi:hypothetical protein